MPVANLSAVVVLNAPLVDGYWASSRSGVPDGSIQDSSMDAINGVLGSMGYCASCTTDSVAAIRDKLSSDEEGPVLYCVPQLLIGHRNRPSGSCGPLALGPDHRTGPQVLAALGLCRRRLVRTDGPMDHRGNSHEDVPRPETGWLSLSESHFG